MTDLLPSTSDLATTKKMAQGRGGSFRKADDRNALT
jgi:hypothetical protein